MDIPRFLLRPIALLAGAHAAVQARAFLAAHRRTAEAQDRLLAELVAAHAETDFGRDHGFGGIRGYDDFAAAVPLGDYETHRPYVQRVLDGRTEALLPPGEPVLMFSETSGTTGEPKLIPVTPRFLADMRRGWNIFGLLALHDHPRAWLRPILQISSATRQYASPTGLPIGAISGLLAAGQKRIVRRMYVAPPGAADIRDPTARYYTILRCGVGRDVGIITTANPSSTIKLIETGQAHAERLVRDVADGTIQPPSDLPDPQAGLSDPQAGLPNPQAGLPAGVPKANMSALGAPLAARLRFRPDRSLARRLEDGIRRDGRLLPRHFWNVEFLCNWTGGTLKLYLPRLRELFDGAAIRDIGLLASEGRFSVPLADGTPAGAAEITGNFLEFIPAAEYGGDSPAVLRAHQLDAGAEYFLVLSNWAGLWRYSLDDRIRVTGHLGSTPILEFLCRGLHTASITGEKITEHQVVEAMRQAAGELGLSVDRFTLQGRFADTPYYELRVELPAGWDAQALAERMDGALARLNVEYRGKRAGGRLGPIRLTPAPAGFFEQAERQRIRQRCGRAEQYKHQYLLADVAMG